MSRCPDPGWGHRLLGRQGRGRPVHQHGRPLHPRPGAHHQPRHRSSARRSRQPV